MKKKAVKHRHLFSMRSVDVTGKEHIHKIWAVVKQPPKGTVIDLVLKAEHVQKSIDLHGVGNSQTCSMTVCMVHNGKLFPHPVAGYTDWYYSTVYVASKVDPVTGFPSECYRYVHGDEIAAMNDTAAGQKKLLKLLKKNGDQIVSIKARHRKDKTKFGGTGRRDGSRSGVKVRGAKLRAATLQLGYVPVNDPAVLAYVAKAQQEKTKTLGK